MKFNWGHKILLLYLLFMIMIGILVYKSTNQKFDLVSEDYYDKAVKYQNQINNLQNTEALADKPASHFNKNENVVEIKFPDNFTNAQIKGTLFFFKPDNANLDFSVNIELNENNIQKIRVEKLSHGNWKLKTNWTVNNTSYYQEENIFIN